MVDIPVWNVDLENLNLFRIDPYDPSPKFPASSLSFLIPPYEMNHDHLSELAVGKMPDVRHRERVP